MKEPLDLKGALEAYNHLKSIKVTLEDLRNDAKESLRFRIFCCERPDKIQAEGYSDVQSLRNVAKAIVDGSPSAHTISVFLLETETEGGDDVMNQIITENYQVIRGLAKFLLNNY